MVEAPHLQLALEQSDPVGVPGTRVISLPKCGCPRRACVCARTQGYKAIQLVIDPIPQLELKSGSYLVQTSICLRSRNACPSSRDVAHQPGCESELGVRVLGARLGKWENLHDSGKLECLAVYLTLLTHTRGRRSGPMGNTWFPFDRTTATWESAMVRTPITQAFP